VDELAKDLAAYETALPTLLADAGKFALFVHGKHEGTFDTYALALGRGYELAGMKPFLVQQISALPNALHFARAMKFECPTSS
jgi:hypothetical protein